MFRFINILKTVSIIAFFTFSITACNSNGGEERANLKHSLLPDTVSTWTSGAVYDSTRIPSDIFSIVRQVRVSSHENFDRIVFKFSERGIPGFHIEYVDEPVHECGSGKPIKLEGDDWLMIKFLSARMHKEGKSTVPHRDLNPNLPILLNLTTACDFENYVTWIASVKAPQRIQVVALDKPPRLVVEINHLQNEAE